MLEKNVLFCPGLNLIMILFFLQCIRCFLYFTLIELEIEMSMRGRRKDKFYRVTPMYVISLEAVDNDDCNYNTGS